jgi:peptide/nickel transport system permease protein
MTETLIKRLIQSVVVVLVMSALAFIGIHMIGDPIYLLVSPDATQNEIAEAARLLGLDRPIHEQYWRFLSNALHGDLGKSFVFNQPALLLILERMPATLELAMTALFFSLAIGIPMGMIAGLRPDTWIHRVIMGFSIAGVTVPTFWLGLILILIFAVNLGWLPPAGRGPTNDLFGIGVSFTNWEGVRHLLLPALSLSLFKIALVVRLTEAGTREVASQEYIRFARAKGVHGARLMFRHIAPNVMIPIVTAVGLELGHLIAFSIVTESIFAWPGMGRLIIESILQLDRPVVVAYLMVTLLMFVFINFSVDILYLMLDPRIRHKAK